ncbi:MAG TPA: ubiquitin-like domain-containing protein [Anaerolineales bacterium]
MLFKRGLILAFTFLLFACQPAPPPTVTIIDNDRFITLQTDERVVSALLIQAGLTLGLSDTVLANGLPINSLDQLNNSDPITLQIRRAVMVTLVTPEGQRQIQISALTVGEALQEEGIVLSPSDRVDPPLNSPITRPDSGQDSNSLISIIPSRILTITADGKTMQVQSSARTVGDALSEAGIPLLGLDQAFPSENEALPPDGHINIVRVTESVILAQMSIPFESELVASSEVPLDQTQILSPGENGLSVQRIRVRYEDGVEVSRVTEEETLVRAPKTRTLAYGTRVEIKTAVVDGVTIEYWRAVQMYATSYSPCRLGTSTCGSTTASGKQLQKGMVALRTDLYLALRGQPLFIPNYGFATVEDACGGCVGRPWIDLGYSDNDYEAWHWEVTVYFLTPVPQNIVYVLE